MTVILEAISGPILGRRIEVRGGSILRLGRTGKSDYTIAEDGYLSGLHFAVECDGTQCRIRDLGSSNGTFVNGSRITEQAVRHGDSLVAGGSTFRVHVDELPDITGVGMPRVSTEPIPVSAANHPMSRANQTMGDAGGRQDGYSSGEAALLSALYAPDEQVFAVVDASRDPRIPTFLESSGETYLPLSEAAYVVALPADARLVHVLIKDGWGQGWGFYGTSKTGLEKVRGHFTDLVRLRTGSGAEITFRFWDPRVLRALLPAMRPEETEAFFGPCERILVEGEKVGERSVTAWEFSRTPRGPRQQTIMLG